jgi:hypothetical protein
MVAFRHFAAAVSALALVAMNAGISVALEPISSIDAFSVDRSPVLIATRLVVTAVDVDVPVATNTTFVASPVAFDDLFASSIWKDGPFAVTHQEQVCNGTDLFASSLLQTVSASRRLRDSYDIASSLWLDASRRLQDSYHFASSLLRDSSDLVAAACEQDSSSMTVLQALRSASRYAITTLTIGSSAFYCIVFGLWQVLFGCVGDDRLKLLIQVVGSMVIAFIAKYVTEAIWHYFWSVLIHDADDGLEDADDGLEDADDASEDADDVLEDVDDVLEDVDEGVAGQDDVPVEAPVATVTIAAPLRRSKRVAAQLCRALCSEVGPSICAASGPRRSARLAAKSRVTYKPHPACH